MRQDSVPEQTLKITITDPKRTLERVTHLQEWNEGIWDNILPKSVCETLFWFESWGWSELWGVRACWTKEKMSTGFRHQSWSNHQALCCGPHQDVVDVIDVFSTDRDAVDLQDFIPLTEETALLCRPTTDHPTDNHTVTIVSNRHTLITHTHKMFYKSHCRILVTKIVFVVVDSCWLLFKWL